jgi:hypothetical protein
MKKLIVFLGILALVIGTGGIAKVYAGNITIYDNASSGTSPAPYAGVGTGGEDQETEPITYSGQGWDLEAFRQNGATLSIIGGFNFKTGVVPVQSAGFSGGPVMGSEITEGLGALFFKSGGAPPYGVGNTPGTSTQMSNDIWGYNYAITFAFNDAGTGGTYTLYTSTPTASVDLSHGAQGVDYSNPWTIYSGWTKVTDHAFTYATGLTDEQVSLLGDALSGGSHNVIDGIDLSFLIPPGGTTNPDLVYLHLTYECGNDNLMGRIPASSVPIPPSALLLGSGLLGLVGLGWRRRKTNA